MQNQSTPFYGFSVYNSCNFLATEEKKPGEKDAPQQGRDIQPEAEMA